MAVDQNNTEYIVIESTAWIRTWSWPWPPREYRVARAICRSHSVSYQLFGGGWWPTTWALSIRGTLADRTFIAKVAGLGLPTDGKPINSNL